MATRPRGAHQAEEPEVANLLRPGGASIGDRIAAFVMLDAMPNGTTQAQRCVRLSIIGFSNTEIANLLQTSSAVVASNLYQERKKPKKPDAGKRRVAREVSEEASPSP